MPFRCVSRSFLVAVTLAGSLAIAEADEAARGIETTGQGIASAKPDFASIIVGVQSAGKTAQAALAENSKATAAVIDALRGAGVETKDIQTSDFSIWPRMSNGANGADAAAILGYSVSNRVTVVQHDLARLGDMLDKAVTAGANSVYGVQFEVSGASALLDEARKAAFDDARRKAQNYAAEAGVKLGPLLELEETSGAAPVYLKAALSAPAPSTPIAAGESKLTVSVRARFAIERDEASKP